MFFTNDQSDTEQNIRVCMPSVSTVVRGAPFVFYPLGLLELCE